jgi:purine-binding chemotaxis protein CheW
MNPNPPTTASGSAVAPAPAQYLTFWLGEEVLGMDIRTVREIIQCGPMATVPLMPKFLRGVINLRGAVLPVIDLNARFGRPATRIGKKSCIVIFDAVRSGERAELGLLVDAVSEVLKIGAEHIEPPPDFGTTVRRDFICGIAKLGQRFVFLLDPDRALDVQEMASLCGSAQEVGMAAPAW